MKEELLQFQLQSWDTETRQDWLHNGYTQEEGIDYDEMDVKSAFLYGTIEKEVYVCQPPSFEDPQFPDKVYKVQVTPKMSHLPAVKRIFRYLKGQPKLGLWLSTIRRISNFLARVYFDGNEEADYSANSTTEVRVTTHAAKIPHWGCSDAQTSPETTSKTVLALEEAKTAQDKVITRLKLRVKRLEKKRKRIVEERVVGEKGDSTADQIKRQSKVYWLKEELRRKPVESKNRDQGLAQIESDAELAQRLHKEELAELDRAQKEKQNQEEATSAALAEEFDEIQARIDADHELAVRLTHKEQEKYIIEERARLLAEFFERRKKQLAAERAEAIRNKPPTRTQVRNMMITYLKHMGKYTHQQLKHKNFEEVQKLYEREKKWIDDFKPIDDDSQQQAESTKKRPRADSEEESSKKQKLEEDNDAEKEELRDSMDVVPRDDVAIDVESLATKYPIVDWKTHILNENMMYYQIIRADGSSKNYKIFSEMLDDFDRQDVIDLHRLVNERYETTSPEGYDLLLWGDLKTLFEPNEEDEIWKNQQDYNLISWRLFDSCGVHVLLMNTGVAIHMMIEKKYPLTQEMLSRMLNRRLEVNYESEMAFELLRFTRSQL
ncbi:ribonuclease H-like domain-containing protein [Tanacetum coccineum]